MFEVLTLRRAWFGTGMHEICARVTRGDRPAATPAERAAAPAGYIGLMGDMWAQDAVARPTFTEALKRLWAMTVKETATTGGGAGGGAVCELDLVSDLFDMPLKAVAPAPRLTTGSLTVADYVLEYGPPTGFSEVDEGAGEQVTIG